MSDVDIGAFAYGVLMEATPSIPADVFDVLRDEIKAGEYFLSLIELVELAPQVVSSAAVDVLEQALIAMPQGVHRRVGLDAVAAHRALLTA